MKNKYKKTLIACYLGFITQAISANFAPLLFLTFHPNLSDFCLEGSPLFPQPSFSHSFLLTCSVQNTSIKSAIEEVSLHLNCSLRQD